MKYLVVYYSRTRVTAGVAKEISKKLGGDIEEIKDTKNRSGVINYIFSAFDALRKSSTKIETPQKNPKDYDLIIVGTPVWVGTAANPVLTYLRENKDKFNEVALIATFDSSGGTNTIENMEKIIGKDSIAQLTMSKLDIKSSFNSKIDEFINIIKEKSLT
jgi:flavodoxin